MFGGGLDGITEALFNDVAGEIPTKELERPSWRAPGCPLVELLVHSGLCPSKGQARKDIEGGGIYLNNVRVAEAAAARRPRATCCSAGTSLLRKGKRSYVAPARAVD